MKVTEKDIISDEQIEKVHAYARFEATPKRDVVKYALLKVACGQRDGYTAETIIIEHGLATRRSDRNLYITTKGKKYLWAAFRGDY